MAGKKPSLPKPMGKEERLKYEIAEELGLIGRVSEVGWGGLTAVETGRIGGLIRAYNKKERESAEE